MKYAEYHIEDNTVAICNSIIGIESIHLNGCKPRKVVMRDQIRFTAH